MSKTKIKIKLTLVYWKEDGLFIGKLEEFPYAISQGKTMKELKENINDALLLVPELDR